MATYAARCIENEILMTIRASKKTKGEVSLQDPIGIDKEGNEITLIDILGTDADMITDQVELKLQKEASQENANNPKEERAACLGNAIRVGK